MLKYSNIIHTAYNSSAYVYVCVSDPILKPPELLQPVKMQLAAHSYLR